MKAFQIKYSGVPNGRQHITGSRNNGPDKVRTRKWRGPRSKLLSGTDKRLARHAFDKAVKHVLA